MQGGEKPVREAPAAAPGQTEQLQKGGKNHKGEVRIPAPVPVWPGKSVTPWEPQVFPSPVESDSSAVSSWDIKPSSMFWR